MFEFESVAWTPQRQWSNHSSTIGACSEPLWIYFNYLKVYLSDIRVLYCDLLHFDKLIMLYYTHMDLPNLFSGEGPFFFSGLTARPTYQPSVWHSNPDTPLSWMPTNYNNQNKKKHRKLFIRRVFPKIVPIAGDINTLLEKEYIKPIRKMWSGLVWLNGT